MRPKGVCPIDFVHLWTWRCGMLHRRLGCKSCWDLWVIQGLWLAGGFSPPVWKICVSQNWIMKPQGPGWHVIFLRIVRQGEPQLLTRTVLKSTAHRWSSKDQHLPGIHIFPILGALNSTLEHPPATRWTPFFKPSRLAFRRETKTTWFTRKWWIPTIFQQMHTNARSCWP